MCVICEVRCALFLQAHRCSARALALQPCRTPASARPHSPACSAAHCARRPACPQGGVLPPHPHRSTVTAALPAPSVSRAAPAASHITAGRRPRAGAPHHCHHDADPHAHRNHHHNPPRRTAHTAAGSGHCAGGRCKQGRRHAPHYAVAHGHEGRRGGGKGARGRRCGAQVPCELRARVGGTPQHGVPEPRATGAASAPRDETVWGDGRPCRSHSLDQMPELHAAANCILRAGKAAALRGTSALRRGAVPLQGCGRVRGDQLGQLPAPGALLCG